MAETREIVARGLTSSNVGSYVSSEWLDHDGFLKGVRYADGGVYVTLETVEFLASDDLVNVTDAPGKAH